MFLLIRNGDVYDPKPIGRKDILICCNKIIKIDESINFPDTLFETTIIDGSSLKIVPGFIDQHVHFTGGGGEGGFVTRTPEIMLSDLTLGGITTAVGLLGADGITRNVEALLAKAHALEKEGISTYIYTGCYSLPTRTISGDVRSDIVLIEKIIGTGEIAISDHRSSQPSLESLIKISSEARIAGLLSNKCGIVHLHIGDAQDGIKSILNIVDSTSIPIKQFMPSHVNRARHVVEQSLDFIKKGGYVDLTSDIYKTPDSPDALSISDTLKFYKACSIPLSNVCASSDSNGSIPKFDELGNLVDISVGQAKTLFRDIRQAIIDDIVTLEEAISLITTNPAKALKLYPNKGRINKGSDADLVLLDKNYDIDTVISKGKIMVKNGTAVVKGYFEK